MPIINDPNFDPNTIRDIIYPWARYCWKKGVANNWVPQTIPMREDAKQWKTPNSLSEAEKNLILLNLGFFSTAELLTANNLVAIFKNVTNSECLQYLCRQIYEEAVHAETFVYSCKWLGVDTKQVWNMYLTVPSIKKKDDFVVELTKSIANPNFTTYGEENIRAFLHDLIGYYVIMEGIFFYAGFAMMLALGMNNKVPGIAQQFDYIMKDESLHLLFGCGLINTITGAVPDLYGPGEYPQVWTDDFKKEITKLIKKAVDLEKEYVQDACPEGIVEINPQQFCKYVEYIADRRLVSIGLEKVYKTENPFEWMSTAADLNKRGNFFETRITEYQTGGNLNWDSEEEN